MNAQSRIIIFCGKGGVGKTTLSLALGLKHAAQGRKVVVVSSHPVTELAITVSLEGLAEEYPAAVSKLFIVHLDPKELLGDVVRENFPVPVVARAVLRSRIYQNLIEVAPGLKEFYFLARLQQLAERKASASGTETSDYHLLVWDAPATGHFLTTLRSAKSFETYLPGPLASTAAELARFFSNDSLIRVLPTTTLEEMAIEETVETCRALEKEFHLRASTLLLNLVSPLAGATDSEVEQVNRTSRSSPNPALRFAVERGMLERERVAALRATIAAPTVLVERVRHWTSDLDLLRQVGGYLEGLSIKV